MSSCNKQKNVGILFVLPTKDKKKKKKGICYQWPCLFQQSEQVVEDTLCCFLCSGEQKLLLWLHSYVGEENSASIIKTVENISYS